VAIILKELNIPYENKGITLFESGAIIEYLVETYDKENKLQPYTTAQEKYLSKSWLHFQMSGQGPYFGKFEYTKIGYFLTRYRPIFLVLSVSP
jgi:glutathione S-transferase